jgi:hypothetical protein
MSIDAQDTRSRRCPMLGHEIRFSYCRQPGGATTPCRKIFDCWFERFDIREFMQANYPAEVIDAILQPKQPKVASLLEIIQRVQKPGS